MTTTVAPRFARAVVAGLTGVASMVGGVELADAQTQPNACELLTETDAKTILGKAARRETDLAGAQATSCSYVVAKDATRVVGLAVGEFSSGDEAVDAFARSRATAQFDGLKIESGTEARQSRLLVAEDEQLSAHCEGQEDQDRRADRARRSTPVHGLRRSAVEGEGA